MPARRLLYVDASAGASGDMILGALVDLGVPLARIRRAVETLPLSGWRLVSRKVIRSGIAARKVDVRVGQRQPPRGWSEIRSILRRGRLDPAVRDRALEVFRKLVEAEAEVHGTEFGRVHLHEAGAVDAIIDVVGACEGLHNLEVEHVVVSPMTTGWGTVACSHGTYPVPAPATALLIRGAPVCGGEIEGERLTPTGAAILTTVASGWGPPPAFRPLCVGYGAGSRSFPETPNLLRMTLGEVDSLSSVRRARGRVVVLEATLDDAPPQNVAYAVERLFEAGALDVHTATVHMKKGRIGHLLTVLARPADLETVAAVMVRETTTLGLRYRVEDRIELERSTVKVRTRFGPVRVKVGLLAGELPQVWPEYEDCAALARRAGVPLREIQRAALEAHRAAPAATAQRSRRPKERA